jgi:hypothetical protein
VELEDLLKLKKLERPDPVFWEQFDEGLRRKSLEALHQERRGMFSAFREQRWLQPVAVAAACTFCGVPTYMGVHGYYAELHAQSRHFEVSTHVGSPVERTARDSSLAEAATRELARKKQSAENMRFVVDSYSVDPSAYSMEQGVWEVGEAAWRDDHRTYVNDRVQVLPGAATLLPVNLSH